MAGIYGRHEMTCYSKGPVCLQTRAGGNEVKPDFIQFVPLFMVTVSGVRDYFDDVPYDVGTFKC